MKRWGWVLTTLFTLILTGFVLSRAGWFTGHHPGRFASRRSELHARVHDPLTSDAALRWRRGQPAHWRMLILQR